MNINTLKQSIVSYYAASNAFADDEYSDQDRILSSCMMFEYAMRVSESGKSATASDVVSSYADTFSGKIIDMRDSSTGYWEAADSLKSTGKDDFLQLNSAEISNICAILSNSVAKAPFSISKFDETTYGFSDLPIDKISYLNSMHNSVMATIAKYFVFYFGIKESDVHIDYASDGMYPGREIWFHIDGISLPKIIRSIRNDIGISLFSYEIRSGSIRVIAA